MSNKVVYRAFREAYLCFIAREQPTELSVKTNKEYYEQPKHYKTRVADRRSDAVQAESD